MAETRGFEPLDDITIIDYLVGSCFKPDSAMFPKNGAPSGSRNRIYSFGPRIKT